MKTFKEFLAEAKPSYNKWRSKGLSWDQSPLYFDSSFGEIRPGNLLGEATKRNPNKNNRHGAQYNAIIHDDADVKPSNLTKNHKLAIHHYCSTESDNDFHGHESSRNMNSYLRNRSGDKSQKITGGHSENMVKSAVQKLSSAFTPENTNKKEITTWSGVPAHIGEHLINSGEGSEHHIPGFTSTSTDKRVANDYSQTYGQNSSRHIIQYHVKPGAGLSAAHHSIFDENEIILHHGARVQYSHTESTPNDDGSITYVHHVTVHPEHKPLHEYGEYHHHPKN